MSIKRWRYEYSDWEAWKALKYQADMTACRFTAKGRHVR